MSDERSGVGARPIDLAGDGPELIAFALLRYLAQIEQQDDSITFDRAWLLDAYAECLTAVRGERSAAGHSKQTRSPAQSKTSPSRRTARGGKGG